MRMYDIIIKKRNGEELTDEEISYFISGYTKGQIPDYQASALLMAIYFKGMSEREITTLTLTMAKSGEMLDLSGIEGVKVDKHSSGGVGDKTTIVLGPMVAAAGVRVAKMSGRGLGHTGGTIDKFESFKGFNTAINIEDFIANVNKIGIAIAGQTGNLAPADKKLYALRDVTATVESIPLIASSIMSKKIASGSDAIVLDVKVGSGAFMKDDESALRLAREMVKIGTNAGKVTIAIISNMDEPLGYAVGNALEVKEAIDVLSGKGPKDLHRLCLRLGSAMLFAAKKAKSFHDGVLILQETIENGKALEKLAQLVEAQGGDKSYVYDTSLFPKAKYVYEVKADFDGFVNRITSDKIGIAAMILGAGRETKESTIDLSAGIVLNKKVGDSVFEDDVIATLYTNMEDKIPEAEQIVKKAFKIGMFKAKSEKLLKYIVYDGGEEVLE